MSSPRSPDNRLAPDFADLLAGPRIALGAALGLWVGDAILLAVTRAGATWAQWAEGMGSAALVAASTALLLGGLVGPVVLPLVRQLAERAGAEWARVRSGDADARHEFLALTLMLPFLLALWAAGIYRGAIAIVFRLARPDTIAGAITIFVVAFTAFILALFPAAVRLARAFIDRLSTVRATRWLIARAWPIPALLAVAVLYKVGRIVSTEGELLASLPWLEATPLLGLLLGLVFAIYLPRGPAWLRRAAFALTVFVLAFSCASGFRMRREWNTAQKIAFTRALSGRAGYAAWTRVLDFDRDGQLNVLGGGDCAPFDPRRFTGAPDPPGDGIDQDCDGIDSAPVSLGARPPLGLDANALPKYPTVILVTVDALAAPELTALRGRSGRGPMPRLDEFAGRSMLFAHAFAQGPSTRLSFPSIFTSRWDSQQIFEESSHLPYSFSAQERTLQEAFDDAGYETVAVIPDVYFSRTRWASLTKGFRRIDQSALSSPTGKQSAREVTDAALGILSAPSDRPLYLWMHYYDAHPPYRAPPGSSPRRRDDRTLYELELGFIDGELGRLIDAIDARPDPTYLIFTADHATSFHPVPASRRGHYGYDIYTSTLHVPLIFHGPGLHVGRDDDVVSTMDIAPTLANLFHLADRGRFEGTSLASELIDGVDDPKRVLFHEYNLPENEFRGSGDPLELVSARSDKYDLILNRERGTYELYDWTVDYFEQHDLYEERARQPEVTHLRALLGAFVRKYSRWNANAAPVRGASAAAWPRLLEDSPAAEP